MTDQIETLVDPVSKSTDVSMLDLIAVLVGKKRLVLGLPFMAALIMAGISLSLPNIYTASTVILPPQQGGSSAALLAQLAGGVVGGALGSGLRNPSDLYVAMLRSRTIEDKLIERFDLMTIYDVSIRERARSKFKEMSKISAAREGTIVISTEDTDPKRAAELANGYVEELYKLTQVLAITESSQRRLFFERHLLEAKDKLSAAELAARQQLAQGGVVKVDEQGRSIVTTTAQWRAKISAQEVQISAMRAFASDANPDLKLAQRELEAMQAALAKLEDGPGKGQGASSKGLQSLRVLRDVKYYETLYELLAKQYEVARIDESKDASLIQVLDKAVVPELKSKPKRAVMVLLAAAVAAFAVTLWISLAYFLQCARRNPEQARRLDAIGTSLRGR